MKDHARERREFIRVPFATRTTVRAGERIIRSGSSLDVSLNGLRIATPEPAPAEGTACEVEIVLEGSDPAVVIAARGSIIRSSPGTLAVRFVEIDLDSYQHLQQLILNNTERPERAEQEFRSHRGIRKPAP